MTTECNTMLTNAPVAQQQSALCPQKDDGVAPSRRTIFHIVKEGESYGE